MQKIDRLGWAAGTAFTVYGTRIGVRVTNPMNTQFWTRGVGFIRTPNRLHKRSQWSRLPEILVRRARRRIWLTPATGRPGRNKLFRSGE